MLKRTLRWWPVAVVLLGVAAGLVGQRLSSAATGGWSTFWFVVAIVGGAVAALTTIIERLVRESRDVGARGRQRVALNDALDPAVEALAKQMTRDPKERAKAKGQFVQQVLASASRINGVDRVRASYFTHEWVDGNAQVSATASTGRSGAPSTVFVPGTTDGDFVLGMMRRGGHFFCPDTDTRDVPSGWNGGRDRDYRTFISVAATAKPAGRASGSVFGFLSVDAPNVGDLSADDVPFLKVLATLIAVSELLDGELASDTPQEQS